MPKYDYECQYCGAVRELKRGRDENQIYEICYNCCIDSSGRSMSLFNRVFTQAPNFILKGAGWGRDNYQKFDKSSKGEECQKKK